MWREYFLNNIYALQFLWYVSLFGAFKLNIRFTYDKFVCEKKYILFRLFFQYETVSTLVKIKIKNFAEILWRCNFLWECWSHYIWMYVLTLHSVCDVVAANELFALNVNTAWIDRSLICWFNHQIFIRVCKTNQF